MSASLRFGPLFALTLGCAGLGTSHAEGVRSAIQFPAGASSAKVSQGLARGDTDRYEIVASKGQTMTLGITSEEGNAVFTLYRPGYRIADDDGISTVVGATLAGAGEGEDAMQWQGVLPVSGRYLIDVGATRGGATYQLGVAIQ